MQPETIWRQQPSKRVTSKPTSPTPCRSTRPWLWTHQGRGLTLMSRDLKQLSQAEGPYDVEALHPVDFFPQTTHLECLTLLRLR